MQTLLLTAYRKACGSGLLKTPLGSWAFESAYLAYKKFLEAPYVSVLAQEIPPGTMVVDVGANIGFFSLYFGKFVGPQGKVLAVEPEEKNHKRLQDRVRSAGFSDRIETLRAFVADAPGKLPLEIKRYHPADHKIGKAGPLVDATTLDTLCALEGRRVSFIKIDVQGAEYLVLQGGLETLRQHRPTLLLEVDGEALERMGSSVQELSALLQQLKYQPHRLSKSGKRAISFQDLHQPAGNYSDILFVPNST